MDNFHPGYNVFREDTITRTHTSFVFLLIGINNRGMGHIYFYITDKMIYHWFVITYGYIPPKIGMQDLYSYITTINFTAPKLNRKFMEYLDIHTNKYNRRLFTTTFKNHSSYRKLHEI